MMGSYVSWFVSKYNHSVKESSAESRNPVGSVEYNAFKVSLMKIEKKNRVNTRSDKKHERIYFGENQLGHLGKEIKAYGSRVLLVYGGDVTVVHLTDIEIYGNTHFMLSDLNNVQIADLLSKRLRDKGRD